MIAALAAGLAALVVVAPLAELPTARDLGRASVMVGMCSTIGWSTTRERVLAAAEAFDAGLSAAERTAAQAGMQQGIADAQVEVNGHVAAFRANGDRTAFKARLRSICDGVARDLPTLMDRTPDTEALFDGRIDALFARPAGT